MKKPLLMTAAALMLVAGPALAEHHEGMGDKAEHKEMKMQKHFEMVDTDSNGTISESEYMAKVTEKWGKMDADSNGEVSMDEFKNFKKAEWEEKKAKWKARKEAHGDDDHDEAHD